jgi:hypothetical protein
MALLDSSRLFDVSQLDTAPIPLADTDVVGISRSNATKPTALSNVLGYIQSALTSVFTWGGITAFPSITAKDGSFLEVLPGATGVAWSGGTGTGGTVTQATNRSTGVTLNKISGEITMNAASLAAGANVSFTVTNSSVAATDIIIANIKSFSTGQPSVHVITVAAGSFTLMVRNNHASTADTTADKIAFRVIKASIS